jgi:hypothetical protein
MFLLCLVQVLCHEISLTDMYSLPKKTVGTLSIPNYRDGDKVQLMSSDTHGPGNTNWKPIGEFEPNGPDVEYTFEPTLPSNKYYCFAINKNGHLNYSKPCRKTGLNTYEIYHPKNSAFDPVERTDKRPGRRTSSNGVAGFMPCLCGLALLVALLV